VNERVKPLYEFGTFRIDAARRQLLLDGAPVVLTAKAFDLLLVLVERGGEVVSKDELMQALWPSTVVIEANLTQQGLSADGAAVDAQVDLTLAYSAPDADDTPSSCSYCVGTAR
jgi:hypothetical protein